jgi:hypothetical protein
MKRFSVGLKEKQSCEQNSILKDSPKTTSDGLSEGVFWRIWKMDGRVITAGSGMSESSPRVVSEGARELFT